MPAPVMRPQLETLEPRDTPAVTWNFAYSSSYKAYVLTFTGDNANNTLKLSETSSGYLYVSGSINGMLRLNNGTYLKEANVGRIHMFAYDGSDVLHVYSTINRSTILNAGNGDDTVVGGAGNDTIFGGYGHDLLWGQNGNDIIYGDYSVLNTSLDGSDQLNGGDGADYLVGGYGVDWVWGGRGKDTFGRKLGDSYLGGWELDAVGATYPDWRYTYEGGNSGTKDRSTADGDVQL